MKQTTDAPAGGKKDGKASGIDVKQATDWLLRHVYLRDKNAGPPPVEQSREPTFFFGGTPNMKKLYGTCLYAHAPSDAVHRERMRLLLASDQECHYQSEPLSSTHGQLYDAASGASLLVAERAKDEGIADLAIESLATEYAIHRVVEIDGEKWCPGARAFKTDKRSGERVVVGANEASQAVWDALHGRKPRCKLDKYYVGAWCLAACRELTRERIIEIPTRLQPLAGDFHARRYAGGDFVAWWDDFDPAVTASEVTRSAGVLDGKRWLSVEFDHDRLAQYEGRESVMLVDPPRGVPAGRRERRG